MDLTMDEMSRLIDAANEGRCGGGASPRSEASAEAERRLDARFRTSETLAVYGTLAPGEPNHDVVAPLGGEWTDGFVEGDLHPVGWGASLGYPAFRPRAGGPPVAVRVLKSPGLPDAWPELDRFEGEEYRRILVPVFTSGLDGAPRLLTAANLYAAAEGLA